MPPLTERQSEVAERVARGMLTKQIAHELHISPRTVEVHVQQAAERISGNAPPRHKLTLWFMSIDDTGKKRKL